MSALVRRNSGYNNACGYNVNTIHNLVHIFISDQNYKPKIRIFTTNTLPQ